MGAANKGSGEARGVPGRRPIDPKERLRNRVTVNLNDREYRELMDAASEGESASAFARRIIVRYLARRR